MDKNPNISEQAHAAKDSPTLQDEGVRASDIVWLRQLKVDGHCGEGTLERTERERANDRIDRIVATLSQGDAWSCMARKQNTGADTPADCDWPVCGCDPAASKVIEALEEMGAMKAHHHEAALEKIARCPTMEEAAEQGIEFNKHEAWNRAVIGARQALAALSRGEPSCQTCGDWGTNCPECNIHHHEAGGAPGRDRLRKVLLQCAAELEAGERTSSFADTTLDKHADAILALWAKPDQGGAPGREASERLRDHANYLRALADTLSHPVKGEALPAIADDVLAVSNDLLAMSSPPSDQQGREQVIGELCEALEPFASSADYVEQRDAYQDRVGGSAAKNPETSIGWGIKWKHLLSARAALAKARSAAQ